VRVRVERVRTGEDDGIARQVGDQVEEQLKIHEYQAKAILARHGVPVPQGEVAFTPPEARDRRAPRRRHRRRQGADSRRRPRQGRRRQGRQGTRRGRRGSRGAMLGMTLVTHQTGPERPVVSASSSRRGSDRPRALPRPRHRPRRGRPRLMASQEGGVEIEKVAERRPDRIFKGTSSGRRPAPFQARSSRSRSASRARRSARPGS
jgi:succinyl-CoA synthetase beta subunit